MNTKPRPGSTTPIAALPAYGGLVTGIAQLLDTARHVSARAVNAVMTATYWEIGRRIVEFEQGGKNRAEYGEELLNRLSTDLTARFGRGFSRQNLQRFRLFFTDFPATSICSTVSSELQQEKCSTLSGISSRQSSQTVSGFSEPNVISQTLSAKSDVAALTARFPLPWSHYVRLLSVDNPQARTFYETEALRGGWSVRQLP